ncbi:hypothetical protein [Georgenia wangjunii]|uniref:hypothetical protein n=1 Tax=Georgenia wangjunii TaxID=3117730 RepID=UPI002F26D62D
MAALAVVGALAFVTVTASLWLWRGDRVESLHAGLASLLHFSVFVAVYLGTRRLSQTTAGDSLEVNVRTRDGHPRLSRRWSQAQIWPGSGALRITPYTGSSVAPFSIDATRLEVVESPHTWRDAFTRPVGAGAFVRIPTDEGTIEMALPAGRLPWLRESLDAGSGPREPRPGQ